MVKPTFTGPKGAHSDLWLWMRPDLFLMSTFRSAQAKVGFMPTPCDLRASMTWLLHLEHGDGDHNGLLFPSKSHETSEGDRLNTKEPQSEFR